MLALGQKLSAFFLQRSKTWTPLTFRQLIIVEQVTWQQYTQEHQKVQH